MPNAHAYVRNHFPIPELGPETYRLTVAGLVDRPLRLSLHDVQTMPLETRVVTLECAGNGRAHFDPRVDGEPWAYGAVSTAEWTGVPLAEVLRRAGARDTAQEVLFRGADGGSVAGHDGPIRFERSLALDDPVLGDALLAYAMNGEPLPQRHGYPLRLVVPGWYGVASVKWLTEIELVEAPFRGHYQFEKYWYEWPEDGAAREPVTRQRVRALITEPAANDVLQRGDVAIRGVAWSGSGPIVRVDVALGDAWQEARLVGAGERHRWQRWELITRIDEPGALRVSARATDIAGTTQPERARWNRGGYGNNSVQRITVEIA